MTGERAVKLMGRRRWLRAARVIHPFPTLANVLAVCLFAGIAEGGVPPAGATTRLAASMLLLQAAIGAANDAVDADLDRASKPSKPIASGALSTRQAWAVAAVGAILGLAVAATFGTAAWLLAVAGLSCGLAYDLRLKRTAWSATPYLVALPLLPLWVWTALGRFHAGLLAEYPLGVLIGLALYLGNTAPDIAADSAAGVRGAAHRLGLRRTLRLAWSAQGAAILLGTLLALTEGYSIVVLLPASALAALLLGAAILVARPRSSELLVRAWGLLVASSLVFAAGWLASAR
jgi:4-hydroxybenzoate polyprenyltransferase